MVQGSAEVPATCVQTLSSSIVRASTEPAETLKRETKICSPVTAPLDNCPKRQPPAVAFLIEREAAKRD